MPPNRYGCYEVSLPLGLRPTHTVTTRAGALAIGGGPEPADVVEQHIQPRVRGENLGGQTPDLGLRRHVGDEDVHRGGCPTRGDRGGGPLEARPIAAALPSPPVPPVINTGLAGAGLQMSASGSKLGTGFGTALSGPHRT
jgi:hypothetical protein